MKKKLTITFVVIAVFVIAGYVGYRCAVNYIFDEYVMKNALTALSNSEKTEGTEENEEGIKVQAILDGLAGKNSEEYIDEGETEHSEGTKGEKKSSDKKTDKKETKKDSLTEEGKLDIKEGALSTSKKENEKNGFAATIKKETGKKNSGGTGTGSGSAASGKRLSDSEVLERVMKDSNLAYKMASMVSYSDKQAVISMVKSNFTSKQIADMVASGMSRSEMISVARSSITGAQWSQCMAIARKYVDQIRPYVE
ncbi:MAG: hypothetical protein IKW02_00440 [Clostridia bacterium]|nr:hypothetical protein [Clostridia bacterium]